MKKLISKKALLLKVLWAGFFVFVLTPKMAFADPTAGNCDQATQICNPIKYGSIEDLLNAALGIVVQIGTIVAVLAFVYAGFKYITAQGDEKKIEEAHGIFINVVIGTAILLGAKLIALAIQATITTLQ